MRRLVERQREVQQLQVLRGLDGVANRGTFRLSGAFDRVGDPLDEVIRGDRVDDLGRLGVEPLLELLLERRQDRIVRAQVIDPVAPFHRIAADLVHIRAVSVAADKVGLPPHLGRLLDDERHFLVEQG